MTVQKCPPSPNIVNAVLILRNGFSVLQNKKILYLCASNTKKHALRGGILYKEVGKITQIIHQTPLVAQTEREGSAAGVNDGNHLQ
jgi:hypothetical protein